METETVSVATAAAAAPAVPAVPDDTAAAAPPCPSCGEKSAGARDLTLGHFVSEAAQEFTSVEHSKIFRTARALLLLPGFLTGEWAAGRRNRYLKPLNLCLLILTLQVFVYSTRQVSTFDLGRIVEVEKQILAAQGLKHQPVYERLIEGIAAERRVSRETVLESIDERWSRNVSRFQLRIRLSGPC